MVTENVAQKALKCGWPVQCSGLVEVNSKYSAVLSFISNSSLVHCSDVRCRAIWWLDLNTRTKTKSGTLEQYCAIKKPRWWICLCGGRGRGRGCRGRGQGWRSGWGGDGDGTCALQPHSTPPHHTEHCHSAPRLSATVFLNFYIVHWYDRDNIPRRCLPAHSQFI